MVEERSGLEWTDGGILGGEGGEGTRKFSKFPKPLTGAKEGDVLCVLVEKRATCQFFGRIGRNDIQASSLFRFQLPCLVTKMKVNPQEVA